MKREKSRRHFSILGLALLIVVAASSATAQNKPDPAPDIAFTVSMLKPHTHMLEVDSEHAFWNNAALLMYPEGLLNANLSIMAGRAAGEVNWGSRSVRQLSTHQIQD